MKAPQSHIFNPYIAKILAGQDPTAMDFVQGQSRSPFTPGINPLGSNPQQAPGLGEKAGVFNKIDSFLGKPGGMMLMNLLAQQGYSKMPQSRIGAVGRAALMTSQQQAAQQDAEAKRKLMEAQGKYYTARVEGGAGLTPAGLREFEGMTEGLSTEDKELARRIKLGLDARAGISATERIASDPALSALIRNFEAQLAAATEDAKSGVKADADITKTNQDRAQTLSVWEASRGPLMSALEGTRTGPVVGLSPALTSPQQIADGAIAAVAPVLKQLFRAAGEGIFTDRDQQLLLEMVPDRTDHPESRAAKMKMIDAIIAAKLSPIGEDAPPARDPVSPRVTKRYNPETKKIENVTTD